jgi:ADP-ribose pyrophosphatase YjhB (NUDIX family)
MTVNYTRWLRSYVGHQRLLQLASSAFITDGSGNVLLGQRSDVMLWAPPSGVVQLGETPAQTVIREVREESGLDVAIERLIGVYSGHDFEWTYPNGDQAQIVSMFYACRILGGTLVADRREFISLNFYPRDRLPPLMPRYVRMVRDALAGHAEAVFD